MFHVENIEFSWADCLSSYHCLIAKCLFWSAGEWDCEEENRDYIAGKKHKRPTCTQLQWPLQAILYFIFAIKNMNSL